MNVDSIQARPAPESPVDSASPGRDLRLDAMRAAAALAVVLLHVSSNVDDSLDSGPMSGWWVGNIGDSFSRWAVPLFVMISGALLLSSTTRLSPLGFYRRRARKILVPLLFWSLFYTWLRMATSPSDYDAAHGWWWNVLYPIVMGLPYHHLWFLYVIAGLYLVAPFLLVFVQASSPQLLRSFLVVGFLIATAFSVSTTLLSIDSGPMFFLFPLYIPYFVAGYYLRSHHGLKPRPLVSVAVVAGCVALLSALFYWLQPLGSNNADELTHSPLSLPVMAMSLVIFQLGLVAPVERLGRAAVSIIRTLSAASYGIYLVHPLWLVVFFKLGFTPQWVHPLLGIPAMTAAAFALSTLTAMLIARIPLLRDTVM